MLEYPPMVSAVEKLNPQSWMWEKSVMKVSPGKVIHIRSYSEDRRTYSRFFISCSPDDFYTRVMREKTVYKVGEEPNPHVDFRDLDFRAMLVGGERSFYVMTVKMTPKAKRVTLKISHKPALLLPTP